MGRQTPSIHPRSPGFLLHPVATYSRFSYSIHSRHNRARLHPLLSSLPFVQRSISHYGWVCTSPQYGILCKGRLRWDWMVRSCPCALFPPATHNSLYFGFHFHRLISASVGTVVHYGYRECHPSVGNMFLVSCFLTGLAGNIFPFMDWFNRYEYRVSILFFS